MNELTKERSQRLYPGPTVAAASGKEAVIEAIHRLGVKTVQLAFVDMQGVVRGKSLPARSFVDQIDHGASFCIVVLGWDIACSVLDEVTFARWDLGCGDLVARPDLSTFRVVPWEPATAFVLCDLYAGSGEPLEFSPRHILRNMVAEVRKEGLEPYMASELEFYLLDPSGRPVYDTIQCYDICKGAQLEPILRDIRQGMEDLGIYIEASNTEYGPAQLEVNLRYGKALEEADKACLFKYGVKRISQHHGLTASFMSKIWPTESGSGYHVHQSLQNPAGKNVFAQPGHEMGDVMRHYLAGLLKYARDFYVLGAWSVNAYKRRAAYSFGPTRVNWGVDNRTTAMRVVLAEEGTRLENRMGAAEANPYLLLAGNLAAGLEGIRQGLEPPEMIRGDGYVPEAGELLPGSLLEAADLFGASAVAQKHFGEVFVDTFTKLCRYEVRQFETAVHQWERERYLEVV